AGIHDALRRGRYGDARAMLAPFVGGDAPLPEIEGERARWALALALSALDERADALPSALARIEAVIGELGEGAEALARDLQATAALLMRRLEGEGAGGPGVSPMAGARPGDLPAAYALGQPYPNPSTGRTAVPFALPEEARVEVAVYDLLGRRVAVLAEGAYGAGRHVAVLDG